MNKKTRKAALYVRVSTDEQNVDNQLEILKTFANQQNYKVIKAYYEIRSGGYANRPQFHQMLDAARKGEFNTLFIWSLDRFSREGITSTLSYITRLKEYNVSIKSYTEGWLDTTESGVGELIISILSWVAQKERERISERTKLGLKKAKNVGKRGKDKKPRRRSGYYLRYQKEKGGNL